MIIELIKKHKLELAATRDYPLFIMTVVAYSYTVLLRKRHGLSYNAVGVFGWQNRLFALFNIEEVVKQTEIFIENNFSSLEGIFASLQKELGENREKAEKAAKSEPIECMKILLGIYPSHFTALGFYNCFMRYIGNAESRGKLSAGFVRRLAGERDEIARFYLEIEGIMDRCAKKLGEQKGFDGNLMRYMTLREVKAFLREQEISIEKIKELEKRKEGYFYLFEEEGEKEHISTDKNVLEDARKLFLSAHETDILRGYPAHPGVIRGVVHNLTTNKHKKIGKDAVIVANMTLPTDAPMISKCAAIVTDEGGILSHAAIIAREMKKPCVIGTKTASMILKDGDHVEVDADKGIVRKIMAPSR